MFVIHSAAKRLRTTWVNLPLRVKGLVVVAIPLAALLVVTLALAFLVREEQHVDSLVDRTVEVRAETQQVLTLLVNAETGMRGYLLTGQTEFLEPYQEARTSLPTALADLEISVADSPSRSERMDRIKRLTEQRLEVLTLLGERPPPDAGLPQGVEALLVEGKAIMDGLRQELGAMQSEVEQLLDQRMAWKAQTDAWFMAALGTSLLFGLGGGLLAMQLFTTGVVRRIQHLEQNAHRLEQGTPLLPLPPSDDEIGYLGRDLEQAGILLAEREHELRAARSFLEHLISSGPVVIFQLKPDEFGVTYVSSNAERLLGYSPEEIVRAPEFWREHIHPEDREHLLATFTEALDQKAVRIEQEYRFLHKNGSYRWLQTMACLEYTEHDRLVNMLGYALDITERKQVEELVHQARKEAERTNHAKSEFLSRMSHELRTPLNAILGFAQLLELDDLTADQRESTEQILKAGRHLLELINEVLDITRIEAGRQPISIEPVHVREALQESMDLVRPLAAQRNIQIRDDAIERCDLYVLADRQRLKQVYLNLLSNAVKYNREGGAVILSCEERPGDRLRIEVRDTGTGIPAHLLNKLFIPFERLGAEATGIEGTGIGLVLSKRLVELMGGTVGVESSPGQGSTFWVEFPRAESPVERLERARELVPARAEVISETYTVVYIEDNLSNLRLVQRIMAHRPEIKLLAAMQGRLGMELAREHRPDLILLDLHLPDVRGDEVLRQLQEDPETRAIPVIMISADATSGQIERLVAAGAYAYLTKPIDVKSFLQLFEEALEQGKEKC